MKLVPGPLPPLPSGATMERLPLPLPFSPDLLWRYPIGFPPTTPTQTPSSPIIDFKTHLPKFLPSDPRLWSREDVVSFLKWAEKEFDLQPFDLDTFQMNGKALCLLTRNDLSERSPGAGDVLHNVLQLLIRDATILQRCLPSSPVTPTSRHAFPLSPHSHPPTPNWNLLAQGGESFHPSIATHFMAQSNSVTLSPSPSVDSQAGSPQHADTQNQINYGHNVFNGSNGSGSNQSDSDEDSYQDVKYQTSPQNGHSSSPPSTPSAIHMSVVQQMSQAQQGQPKSPKEIKDSKDISMGAFRPVPREFFPDSPEPNTSGRLLWDFLQQLLNDPTQRYTNYIAWKNRETGVFKIVDPAGLAKLWGIQKNHLSMNYDKMSRALRYYYRVNILRKVQGERHCYQFLRNPTELKNIKNISLLRQHMSPTRPNPAALLLQQQQQQQQQQASFSVKTEPQSTFGNKTEQFSVKSEIDITEHKIEMADEEMPTDLSMAQHQIQPTDLSLIKSSSTQHQIQPTDLSLLTQQDIRDAYHSLKTDVQDEKSDNISVI